MGVYPDDIFTPGQAPAGTNTAGTQLDATYFNTRACELHAIESALGKDIVPTDQSGSPTAAVSDYARVADGLYLNLAPSGTDTVGVGMFGSDLPAGLPHVRQGDSGAVPDLDADDLVVGSDGATGISVLSPDASDSQLAFGSPADGMGAYVRWNHSDERLTVSTSTIDGEIRFKTGNEGTAMTLLDDQRVSIGTAAPGGQLKVEQPLPGAVRTVLTLIQRADDQEFIVYRGTSASGELANSLVAEADVTTATRQGFVKVNVINDGQGLTTQDYYMPIYTLA